MTSQINPSNINGAYPVAGQDNNSQGFRDNFTNTSNNFQYAANEITDLQNKAIVSAQLTGGNVLTTQNNMLNSPLINALISDFAATSVALGALTGTVTVDYSAGHYQTVSTAGPISLAFTNWPAAGQAGVVTVAITITNTAHTVTFPAAVSVNTVGVTGYAAGVTDSPANFITFAVTGTYTFTFITNDNGNTITINQENNRLNPFNFSIETLGVGNAISLGTTTTYMPATTANVTTTLASGVKGQIKVLVASNIANSYTVAVSLTSAGWNNGAAGNIAFNAIGQVTTLQCSGSGRWFVVGMGPGATNTFPQLS